MSAPLDPFQYVALAKRDDTGKIRTLQLIYDAESIEVEEGMEFITFTTVIDLEEQ